MTSRRFKATTKTHNTEKETQNIKKQLKNYHTEIQKIFLKETNRHHNHRQTDTQPKRHKLCKTLIKSHPQL